ncbi:MAG: urease accessory protein UreE [Alphaproteobacteria bacterium]|nr:urease accessory protein UreE [Alphaproteobacteria bacterium]
MLKLEGIVGHVDDSAIAAKLHHLRHHGAVEYVLLAPADTQRKRLRVISDAGTDCAIILARDERLEDGSVLLIDDQRAIVVRLDELRWLLLEPTDLAAALELGYFVGNLHWRVKFDGSQIKVAIENDEAFYRERLAPMIERRLARIIDEH